MEVKVMSEVYDVVVKIKEINGNCAAGHKVGNEIIFSKFNITGFMCPYALHAAFPYILVLMFGGALPWEANKDMSVIQCPDSDNPVILEMTRIKSK